MAHGSREDLWRMAAETMWKASPFERVFLTEEQAREQEAKGFAVARIPVSLPPERSEDA